MKWIKRLSQCVEYIEDNLKDEIDMNDLCRISCLSSLYFPRLFEAVTGIQLSEYIRRRRMTLAACELAGGDRKVIDIALDYGYSSSESFSRAFKGIHGISPSYVRNQNPTLKSYPKLTFSVSIKGDSEMNYKIVDKKAFKVLGVSITTTTNNGENTKEIPKFWERINNDGTCKQMCKYAATNDVIYGICFDSDSKDTFKYAVAVSYDGGGKSEFEVMDISACKWAIFECIGPMPLAIQNVWNRIFTEWLPATEYEIAPLPQIEFYTLGDSAKDDYRSEVWIPIKD